jgi:serine/threonine protein kinase
MTIRAGTKLGPYEILNAIGAGGMGEVYKARDTRLDRIVAIKILPAHLADRAELRERFEREAKTIASLNHPHICTLYDTGHQDDIDFLVMEYLEGETLAQRLQKGALPLEQVLQYAIEISDALDKAHRKGVTHRDLKPGNIMLTKTGTKLLDFGLAKLKQEAVPANVPLSELPTAKDPLTAEGTIVGTLQYMAPEQLEGKEADARTDIFAFGTVVYEMATSKKAFDGKSQASVIGAILKDNPPPISCLQPMAPPALDRVVKRCLVKEPDERCQSAKDLTDELKWIAEGGSQVTIPTPPVAHRKIRERLLWAISTVAVLVAAVTSSLFYFSSRATEPETLRFSVTTPETSQPLEIALSPDGHRLVFAARDSSGREFLWVRPLDVLTAQPLSGTEGASEPFWSPDSRFIGFFAKGKLKKIAVSGGGPETICDAESGRGGTWNQEGVILFAPDATSGLYRVSYAGGETTPVTTLDPTKESSHRYPQFLPDGRHFMYFVMSGRAPGIAAGSLDSKQTSRIVDTAFAGRYLPPGFLLFIREGSLIAQPFDVTRLRLTGDPLQLADQMSFGNIFLVTGQAPYSVSETGTLAYRSGSGHEPSNGRLLRFDRQGKLLGSLGQVGYYNPELSPDGKRVAAESLDSQSGTADIWLLDIAEGVPTRFTFTQGLNKFPVWSPDGAHIAFYSNRDGTYKLFQKPSSGAGTEEVLFKLDTSIRIADWSSDGRYIVYYNPNTKGKIHLSVLPQFGDRKPFPFLQTESNEYHVALSQDGRWIAYISDESGRYEVYIQSFPKPGAKWQVSTGGGVQPRWRRDGKELFFVSPDRKLMAVDVKGDSTLQVGAAHTLFETHIFGGSNVTQGWRQQYDVAADGQQFLMSVETEGSTPPINIVLNWTAGLKK